MEGNWTFSYRYGNRRWATEYDQATFKKLHPDLYTLLVDLLHIPTAYLEPVAKEKA